MTRSILIRRAGEHETVAAEHTLPTEAELHDALTDHPELLPTTDFGMGRTAVVGRETRFASGYADLVLIDEAGRICLVEVKKEGSPDTRRVVAQLLDYAAALWGLSVAEFEGAVLHQFLRGQDKPTVALREFAATTFGSDLTAAPAGSPGDSDQTNDMERGLSAVLQSGSFILVVAAPGIPESVQRVLDYLNQQGLRLFGVEFSYFRTATEPSVEVFVPRIAVRPAAARQAGAGSAGTPIDREAYLAKVPPEAGAFVSEVLDGGQEAGAQVDWRSDGPRLVLQGPKSRVELMRCDQHRCQITLQPVGGLAVESIEQLRLELQAVGLGSPTAGGYYWTIPLGEATPNQLAAVADALVAACRELSSGVELRPLEQPVVTEFERNDYNVWLTRAPDLNGFRGRHLGGELTRLASNVTTRVLLEPLRGAQPGWVPRFSDQQRGAEVWPAGEYEGRYRLTITTVEA